MMLILLLYFKFHIVFVCCFLSSEQFEGTKQHLLSFQEKNQILFALEHANSINLEQQH